MTATMNRTQSDRARQHGRCTGRILPFLALCVNLMGPSVALAADGITGEQAGQAGAGVVAAAVAAVAETKRRKRKKVSTSVRDDALRFGWDKERVRREEVAARRALTLKARR